MGDGKAPSPIVSLPGDRRSSIGRAPRYHAAASASSRFFLQRNTNADRITLSSYSA